MHKLKDVLIAGLEQEARELQALAAMIRDGDIKSYKDYRVNYLPHRIRALEQIGVPTLRAYEEQRRA